MKLNVEIDIFLTFLGPVVLPRTKNNRNVKGSISMKYCHYVEYDLANDLLDTR